MDGIKLAYIIITLFLSVRGFSQGIVFFINPSLGAFPIYKMYQLDEFPFYTTMNNYDFKGKKMAVRYLDDRISYKLNKVDCSEIEFKNKTEFADPFVITLIELYTDSLFNDSGITIDSSANDTLEMRLEAIDVWVNGWETKAHGLCQMSMKYKGRSRTYCTDLVNGAPHAPIKSVGTISMLNVIRRMGSAAIREIIEQFLVDLKRQDRQVINEY